MLSSCPNVRISIKMASLPSSFLCRSEIHGSLRPRRSLCVSVLCRFGPVITAAAAPSFTRFPDERGCCLFAKKKKKKPILAAAASVGVD